MEAYEWIGYCRTKQTTEKLYKQADGVWTEAESAAKKVWFLFTSLELARYLSSLVS